MLVRWTKNDVACKHKDWLPNGKKEEFLIFDCWNVFDWFNMHPEGIEARLSEAIPAKIFLLRLGQLNYFQSKKDQKRADAVKTKLEEDIGSLPEDSIAIKENMRDVELAKSPKLWDRAGLNPFEFLKTKIAPLMRYRQGVEPNEASFIQKCEQLSLAVLASDETEIERLRESIGEALNCLPLTIAEVKKKEDELDRVLSKAFWKTLSYDDAQMLMEEFAPLMKYKRAEPRPKIVLDIDDLVQKREIIEYGPITSPKSEYVEDYRRKVERRIKQLAEEHPTLKKIRNDELLTEKDLKELEKTLNSPELFVTEENLQKVYKQSEGSLVEFIKKILGLYEFPQPEEKVAEAFRTFMIEKNYLSADQVNFLRTVQSVFTKKHHIEYSDMFEPPFTNFGPKAPMPLMKKEDLDEVLDICKTLEVQVYSHARS